MSYDPKEIGAGKLVTAKNDGEGGLNFFAGKTDITEKMGGGAMVVEVDVENLTANHTPREVYNAMLNGVVIAVSKEVDDFGYKDIFQTAYSNGAVNIEYSSNGLNALTGSLETNTWKDPK